LAVAQAPFKIEIMFLRKSALPAGDSSLLEFLKDLSELEQDSF